MKTARRLCCDRRGSAAVEMAIVMPLLLALMMGSAEIGNYFMTEHRLIKAVRDGARFAARQDFSYYPASSCGGSPDVPNVVTPTQNLVLNGYLSGGTLVSAGVQSSNITVTVICTQTAGTQTMSGIYSKRGAICGGSATSCAQAVRVTAQVPYWPILASFGFRGWGMQLNASSQAAVAGI
jgi:hypothetical protein